jgi:hypothetical protein
MTKSARIRSFIGDVVDRHEDKNRGACHVK